MTESSLPGISEQRATDRRADGPRVRARYLPSVQVLTELAALGPALGKVADDLRMRLSEPRDDRDAGASAGPAQQATLPAGPRQVREYPPLAPLTGR